MRAFPTGDTIIGKHLNRHPSNRRNHEAFVERDKDGAGAALQGRQVAPGKHEALLTTNAGCL